MSVSGERLSGPEKSKVRPRPDRRNAARRLGQSERGTLLPQEESRGGICPHISRVFIRKYPFFLNGGAKTES